MGAFALNVPHVCAALAAHVLPICISCSPCPSACRPPMSALHAAATLRFTMIFSVPLNPDAGIST